MKRWDPILGYHLRKQIKETRGKQTIGRLPNIGLVDLVTRDVHVQNIGAYYIRLGDFRPCVQTVISLGSFRQLRKPRNKESNQNSVHVVLPGGLCQSSKLC